MLEGHEPDGDTQYRIGSLTKTFVAVLVMRLRDEGRLDLGDPLGKYLGVSQAENVTIAQLLSHTAGLASEADGPWWERTPGQLRPELASILGDQPGRHPAGRLFHYSNPGYALLGALVGELRGQPWHEVLRQEILEPLGMPRTTVQPQSPHARGFAVHPWADVMQLEPAEETGLMAPAGELWSTAEDLCRFAAFLLDGDDRVLAAETLAEMRTPAAPPGDDMPGRRLRARPATVPPRRAAVLWPWRLDARLPGHLVRQRGRRRRRDRPGQRHVRDPTSARSPPTWPGSWPITSRVFRPGGSRCPKSTRPCSR